MIIPNEPLPQFGGMSARDYIAVQIMAGMGANLASHYGEIMQMASTAVSRADCLIALLNASQPMPTNTVGF